ncbi:hypothetical protein [Streptomyces sp. NPDC004266]|uniref:hypothetical protein n=1 Tax=Streptomyces sp. NPDC004266 TaxID=3364693 RepID=UPI00368EC0FE
MTVESVLPAGSDTGTPAFEDPPWVAEPCETLASAYFSAMDGIDEWPAGRSGGSADEVRPGDLPDSVPPPWRDVFAASTVRRSYTLEDVLFHDGAHLVRRAACVATHGDVHGGSCAG